MTAPEAAEPAGIEADPAAAPSAPRRTSRRKLTFRPAFLVAVLLATWLWFEQADLDPVSAKALSNGQVSAALRQHVELTVISTVLVLAIALPLAVLLSRGSLRKAAPVAAIAAVGRATPAIGVLALLVVWLGTGRGAALLGIVACAVLPVLSRTVAGLRAHGSTLREAALAGLRTALVLNVGTATLAAFGGGGGLGVLITTGITSRRMPVLVLGSILTVALALWVEWVASVGEVLVRPRAEQ